VCSSDLAAGDPQWTQPPSDDEVVDAEIVDEDGKDNK